MSFFGFLKRTPKSRKLQALEDRVKDYFEGNNIEISQERLVILTNVTGLMTRIAYADLNIDESERVFIINALVDKLELEFKQATIVVNLAVEYAREFAGLDNHVYAKNLRDVLDENDRLKIVELLFTVAAADGSVDNLESEDIRVINESLRLSPKHFLSARAKVADSLKLMKK